MGILRKAKEGVLWTLLQQFSVQGLNFVVQIFLARLLMPEDFGLLAMISIFISVGQSLMDSGMSTSLIRNSGNTENDYGTVFVSNLCVSILFYIIVVAASPLVSRFYDQDILGELLKVYALVFVLNSFVAVQIAKFSKELQFKKQFTFLLPSTAIGALAGLTLASLGYGVWSLVWMNITQSFVFALTLWLFSDWRPSFIFKKRIFLHHFSFGYRLTLSGLLNTLYLNLYRIIIGKNFSPSAVGYFTHADGIRLFPINQLSAVLNKVTFPLFSNIEDDVKLRAVYVSAMRIVLSLSSALMLILMVAAKPLFLLLFGEKWIGSIEYFQILCIASIFLPIGTYNLNILKVKGRSDLFLRVEVIKKIIGVSALMVAIPFGIKAMVWSLCLTNIFFAFLNGHFSGKFIDYPVKQQIINSFGVLFIALIPAIGSHIVLTSLLEIQNINLILQISVVVLTYFALYFPMVMTLNKSLIKDIRKILKR